MRGILLDLVLAVGLGPAKPAVAPKGQGAKKAIWSTGYTDDSEMIDAVLSAIPAMDENMLTRILASGRSIWGFA